MWTVTLVGSATLLYLWYLWRRKCLSVLKKLGIPGPEPNIIFGNLIEMINKNPVRCQEEWLQKYGKVFGYYAGLIPIVVVADTDLLRRIQISDFQHFIDRPIPPTQSSKEGSSHQLIDIKGKRWKDIRGILTPSFTTSKLKGMIDIIHKCVDVHLEMLEKMSRTDEAFDISSQLRLLSMDIVGGTSFGIKTEFQEDPHNNLLEAVKSIFAVFSCDYASVYNVLPYILPEFSIVWHRALRASMNAKCGGESPLIKLMDAISGVVILRRSNESERKQDLLQIMIDVRIDEARARPFSAEDLTASDTTHQDDLQGQQGANSGKYMTEEEIRSNALLFFIAGFETMSIAMSFTVHFLVHYPEIQKKLRDEIIDTTRNEIIDYVTVHKLHYLDQVLKEAMRFYPPIYNFVNREVFEDVDLGGFKLSKGLRVNVPVYNIHHDPDLWPDPEKFIPERFSPENKDSIESIAYQAFGAGPRNCIGMRFAMMAAKICLARIIKNYNLVRCDKTDELTCKLKFHPNTMSPANGVYIKVSRCDNECETSS